MDDSPQKRKRTILIAMSALDALLGAIVLLIYFGVPPIDISGLNIPRWGIGLVGAVWFFPSLGLLVYQWVSSPPSE